MGMVRNMVDGLTNLVTGLGTRADARTARAYLAQIMSPEQIEQAYEGSAMLRKAVAIPANDRVRAWRDWQAEADQIELIEAEEERHDLQNKVKQAEILRGLGGGAIILVTAGDPALPINVTGKGGLIAANVVSRWHLSGMNWQDDLASPDYGKAEFWTISSNRQGQQRIHPSRVVCFRAEPLPSVWRGEAEDRFWGRGRVPTLLEPAQNLDEALSTFASIIKDALNVDIGIPKMLEMVATVEGEGRLMRRLALMQKGSSVFQGHLYDRGDHEGKGGEKIDRHQVTWTGIPEIIRVYAEALSAASDIPVTRLWGTSAKGLNATGEGDDTNWNKMVESGQKLETGPCLRQIDAALIPSALGTRPPEVWWKFAALDVPSDKSETERFKVWTEAAEKVQLSGAIPDVAFAKAYQNGLSEGGWMPGLDGALAEIPEDERFGLDPAADDTDPSELQATEGGDRSSLPAPGVGEEAPPRRRMAANDATPRTLYVRRDVVNVAELRAWAKDQGLPALQDGLHVTIAHSRTAIDWMKIDGEWSQDDKGQITIQPGGVRIVEPLGDRTAVLLFTSSALSWRHESIIRAGASHDHPDYQPHISLTGEPVDLAGVEPYRGSIVLGPEVFEEVMAGGAPTGDRPFDDARRRSRGQRVAARSAASHFNPAQPRDRFGRWVPTGRRAFIDAAAKGATSAGQLVIGAVGTKARGAISAAGVTLKGEAVALDASNIRHTAIKHSRERGGQRNVTGTDIASARGLLNSARTIRRGRDAKNGSQRFIALTLSRGDRVYTVFEVRKKAVAVVTMWKRS